MSLTKNQHWRWLRRGDIGYIKFRSEKGLTTFMTTLGERLVAAGSGVRLWHTRHLIIIWETEKP